MFLRGPDRAGKVYLVAISTKIEPMQRFWILLPWAAGGHAETGLTQPCALKCDWVVPFQVANIEHTGKALSMEIVELATDFIISAYEEKSRRYS
ncbi:MAG TPA: hypothetical protein VGJ26_21330 [Pirellulales bacterium]